MKWLVFALLGVIGTVAGAPATVDESSLLCEACHLLVEEVKHLEQENKTQQEIVNYVDSICQRLPEVDQQKCLDFVNGNAASLFIKLAHYLDPQQLCSVLPDVCPAGEQDSPVRLSPSRVEDEPEKEGGALECEVCKVAVAALDRLVKSNKSEAEINATLIKLCNDLPGKAAQACLQEEPAILSALENGLDPTAACTVVKLCTGEKDKPVPRAPVSAVDEPEGNVGSAQCDACKLIVTLLENLVQDNSTEAQINATLLKLCNDLPGSLGDLCVKDETAILKALMSQLDPTEACTDVKLCTGVQDKPVPRPPVSAVDEPKENVGSLECDVCKVAVAALDRLVKSNKSEAEINATLIKLCNDLPGKAAQACLQEEPAILSALENGLDPTAACTVVKLCTGEKDKPVPRAPVSVEAEPEGNVGSAQCDACKLIVTLLENLVQDNSTEAQINATLLKLCNDLPGSLGDLCVKDETAILKALMSKLDPTEACTDVKLCTGVQDKPVPRAPVSAVDEPKENVGSLECDVCKVAVAALDRLVKSNKSEAEINATLIKLCNDLPGKAAQACLQEEPAILSALENGLDPTAACTVVKLCTGEKDKPVPRAPVSVEVEPEGNVGSAQCDACKLIVTLLENLVQDNSTEAQINATLLKLCNDLPGSLGDLCVKDETAILKALMSKLDPTEACTDVKLCTGVQDKPVPRPPVSAVGEPKENLGSLECDACKLLVTVLERLVEDNKTEAEINATLYKLCNDLPGDLGQFCLKEEPAILKALETKVDPTQACTDIKICTAENEGIAGIPCDVCYNSLSKLGLQDPESVCATFTACKVEAERYRHDLIHKELDSQPVPPCDLCQFLMKSIQDVLQAEQTEATVVDAMEQMCSLLPREEQHFCERFGSGIVDSFKSGSGDLVFSCTKIGACGGEPEQHVVEEEQKAVEREETGAVTEDREYVPEAEEESQAVQGENVEEMEAVRQENVEEIEAVGEEEEEPRDPREMQEGGEERRPPLLPEMLPEEEIAPEEKAAPESGVGADARCELCEFVVNLLDKELAKNSTADQINATLTAACNALQDPLKTVCLSVDATVVNLVRNGLDPSQACVSSGFCPAGVAWSEKLTTLTWEDCMAAREAADPSSFNEEIADRLCSETIHSRRRRSYGTKDGVSSGADIRCALCKLVVKAVDDIAGSNKSVTTVNDTVYNICQDLAGASLRNICLTDAPVLVKVLEQGLDPEKTCEVTTLCPTPAVSPRLVKKLDTEADEKCIICEAIVEILDNVVSKNDSQAKINNTVYSLCDQLPEAFKTMCQGIAPTLVADVERGASPKKACEDLKLCSDTVVHVDVVPEVDGDDRVCAICKLVLGVADDLIGANRSRARVTEVLKDICGYMPETIKMECATFVANNSADIINWLVLELDPTEICRKVGACDKVAEIRHLQVNPGQPGLTLKKDDATGILALASKGINNIKSDFECDLCKELIKVLDSVLAKNSSEAKINETIYKMCDLLNGTQKLMCKLMAPEIIKALKTGFNASMACMKVKLCPNTTLEEDTPETIDNITVEDVSDYPLPPAPVRALTEPAPLGDLKCNVCEFLVDELDDYLKKNKSIAALNATAFAICSKLPANLSAPCEMIESQLIVKLSEGVDPKQACTIIKVCPQAAVSLPNPEAAIMSLDHKLNGKQSKKCDVCMKVMQHVYDDLSDNYFPIRRRLVQLCDKLPDSQSNATPTLSKTLKQKCEKVAENLVPFLVNFIVIPGVFCLNVGACPDNVQHSANWSGGY